MGSKQCTGLCVAVMVCACAYMASTASAFENLPHYGKCTATAGGKYANSSCTKLARRPESQKYEWSSLSSGVGFTSAKERESGEAVLEGGAGVRVRCATEGSREGEYGPGDQLKNVVLEFSRCESGGAPCSSEGQLEGIVHTDRLHGEPGVVTREAKEEKNIDGSDLVGQGGEFVAEFNCGPVPVLIKGGIVVRAQADSSGGTSGETTNKMFDKIELEYLVEGGKQVPEVWTPNGGGVSHGAHAETTEHLESSFAGAAYQPTTWSFVTTITTSPKTEKVELRQCEETIAC
jgi:hypothetical protein